MGSSDSQYVNQSLNTLGIVMLQDIDIRQTVEHADYGKQGFGILHERLSGERHMTGGCGRIDRLEMRKRFIHQHGRFGIR